MVLLNFGSPLYPAHIKQIQRLTGETVDRIVDLETRDIRDDRPLGPQVAAVVEQAGLSPDEWETGACLVHLPAAGALAGALLAGLHRRLGRFPAVVRILPYGGVEVVDLADLETYLETQPSPPA